MNKVETPIVNFKRYFMEELFCSMAEFTNLYAVQNNVARFPPTNAEEMKIFVGLHLLMGNLHYARVRCYWEPSLRIPHIADAMPRERFSKLRQNAHFVDVTVPNASDRFWKVRPLYDNIRARLLSLDLESHLCVDEQMVPFKGS